MTAQHSYGIGEIVILLLRGNKLDLMSIRRVPIIFDIVPHQGSTTQHMMSRLLFACQTFIAAR